MSRNKSVYKKTCFIIGIVSVLLIASAAAIITRHMNAEKSIPRISVSKNVPDDFPWDLKQLGCPPTFKWLNSKGRYRSLLYQGLPYKGGDTEVFAYYGTPGSLAGDPAIDKKLPGIVIVHGGCRAASKPVVKIWAQRGYAAISMDLDGHGPDLNRLANGGPPAQEYMSYDWNYHAIAKIILAHSLLLSFNEIDQNRTAIVGLSVGGHLTCSVAGIDDRFKAAVSVYGTGFIYEKGFFKDWYDNRLTPEDKRFWNHLFDPSNYIERIHCPFLFAANPNDDYYPLENLIKSYTAMPHKVFLYLDPAFPHDGIGHGLSLLNHFFNQYLKAGSALPVIDRPEVKGSRLYAKTSGPVQADNDACLYFTTDGDQFEQRKWLIQPAHVDPETFEITSELPPQGTTACFFNYFVDSKTIVSSKVLVLTSFLNQE